MPSAELQFFLGMGRAEVLLDCIQINHPNFSQSYYKCRNCDFFGIDLLHEGATAATHYDYYPLALKELADMNDLDAGFQIDFGDLGEILPFEVDNVQRADGMLIKPTVVYRGYSSLDLSLKIGPLNLQATTFSFDKTGASFEATAPYINNTKTGETYNPTRFPMLRGFLI